MGKAMLVVLALVAGTARAEDTANPPPWKRGPAPTAEATTRADRERRSQEMRNDPAAMRIVWSAWICEAERSREEARTVLAGKDRDLDVDARRELADADRHTAKARAQLKAMKLAPIPCSDNLVGRVAKCVGRSCHGDQEALMYSEAQSGRTIRGSLLPEPEVRPERPQQAPSSLPPWRRR